MKRKAAQSIDRPIKYRKIDSNIVLKKICEAIVKSTGLPCTKSAEPHSKHCKIHKGLESLENITSITSQNARDAQLKSLDKEKIAAVDKINNSLEKFQKIFVDDSLKMFDDAIAKIEEDLNKKKDEKANFQKTTDAIVNQFVDKFPPIIQSLDTDSKNLVMDTITTSIEKLEIYKRAPSTVYLLDIENSIKGFDANKKILEEDLMKQRIQQQYDSLSKLKQSDYNKSGTFSIFQKQPEVPPTPISLNPNELIKLCKENPKYAEFFMKSIGDHYGVKIVQNDNTSDVRSMMKDIQMSDANNNYATPV